MKKSKLIFSICLLFAPLLLRGQFYSAGTDPARVQWRQIKTGTYTIIYPNEVDSLARRYAWLFEKATPHIMEPLRAKTPSIPVVLHPYTMYSNGMVVWAPKRMEMYTTPPSASSTQNWEKQLVLHETRHVGQMSKLGQNFFRFAEFIIGQQSQGLASGGYVTKWMLEGDAVLSETEHSFAGRGREAAFLMPYKAYLLDSISFSWDTWRYGSYKFYTPNDYQFGYYLLSSMRFKHRSDFLSDIFESITKRPYIPYVSELEFKKITGHSRTQQWEFATELMRSIWEQQIVQNGSLTPYRTLIDPVPSPTKRQKPLAAYANYRSVTALSADSVYAFYSNFDRGLSIVQIQNEEQKRHIRYVGTVSSDLVEGGGKLYWTELVPHLRWEQESFSLLRSYDPKTNTLNTLSKKSRYLFPSVSPLAQKIAVVHPSVAGQSFLHILTATDGAIIASYPAPDKGHLQSSAWASESMLYACVLTDFGLGIYALNLDAATWNIVVSPQHQTITRLRYHNELLWLHSDLNGTDNIYVLDPLTTPAQLFTLTNAKYGAFGPYPLDNTLYYANYTHAGLRPVVTNIDSLQWRRASFDQRYESPVAKELSQQVQFRIDTVAIPDQPHYQSKPYRKAQNLFRVHSWAPVYYDALDNVATMSMEELYRAASPGVLLLSQNTLSTAVTQLGYAYRDGFHAGHLKYLYSGWYPVIELSATINDRKAEAYRVERNSENQWVSKYDILDSPSLRASLNMYIPFNLRSRGWVRGIIPRVYLSFRNDQYYLREKEIFNYRTSLQAGVQYYQYRPLTIRNIYPRWGFGLSVQTLSAPWTGEAFGTQLYTMAYGYLPGIVANQGIRLRAVGQKQWTEGKMYYLSNIAAWPRGYSHQASQEYVGFSLDYAIPVWLGDTSLGDAFYFKRLQLIPFIDWAQNKNHRGNEKFFSVGADFLLQFHFLKIGAPISAGVRSIVKADGTTAFQMLLDVAIQ